MMGVQSMVHLYTDSLKSLHNNMSGLKEELASHKRHIKRLKEELTAACKRQLPVSSLVSNSHHIFP